MALSMRCSIHANLFEVAKAYERLATEDQRLILEFVDAFHPPNSVLYFLMMEIYRTQLNRVKGNNKVNKMRASSLEIESVRDYGLVKAENAISSNEVDNATRSHGWARNVNVRRVKRRSSAVYSSDEENLGGGRRRTRRMEEDSEDESMDSEDEMDAEYESGYEVKRGKRKRRSRRANAKEGEAPKTRTMYKLLHSSAVNNIEDRYNTLLAEESSYYDAESCRVEYLSDRERKRGPIRGGDADESEESKARSGILNLIHETPYVRCNGISGFTEHSTNEWMEFMNQVGKGIVGYTVRLNEVANERDELSKQNYDSYDLILKIRVDESRMVFARSAVKKLYETLGNRRKETDEYYEKFENKYLDRSYGGRPNDIAERRSRNERGSRETKRRDEDDDSGGAGEEGGMAEVGRRSARDEYDGREEEEEEEEEDEDTWKRKRGLLKQKRGRETNFKLRKYHTLRELEYVLTYVCDLGALKVIKLIDFAILTSRDAWRLINLVMDRGLEVYAEKKRYPIRESLTGLLFYDRENVEELIGAESDRIFNLDRYLVIWQHGITSKLGNVVAFVISFRRFMRIVVLCCCYFMTRKSTNTRGTVAKHKCTFPAASQGIYYNLFLRMQKGHDLLCRMKVETKEDALLWLKTFDQLRSVLWIKREIPYGRKLSKHLSRRNVEFLRERNIDGNRDLLRDEPTRGFDSFAVGRERRGANREMDDDEETEAESESDDWYNYYIDDGTVGDVGRNSKEEEGVELYTYENLVKGSRESKLGREKKEEMDENEEGDE